MDKQKNLLTVQALRFLAALMVVLVHSTFYAHERLTPWLGVYNEGTRGVRLFFVISGFIMIVSSKKLLTIERPWLTFAHRRLIRIVPLYWAITSIKVVFLLAGSAVILHSSLDWLAVAQSYLFIPALNAAGEIRPINGVGWTLNFEMFFYALFTISLLLKVSPIKFVAPVLVIISIMSLYRDSNWPIAARFYCDPVVLDFAAGMIIAVFDLRVGRDSGIILVAAGLAVLFLPLPTFNWMVDSLLMTVASSSVVVGAVSIEGKVGPRLPKIFLFLGGASYSIYLIHPIVAPAAPYLLAQAGIHNAAVSIFGSVAAALAAGSICYKFGERPVSNWFSAARTKSPVAAIVKTGFASANTSIRDEQSEAASTLPRRARRW